MGNTYRKQKDNLSSANKKTTAAIIKQNTSVESATLENLEKYGRRQNVEFHSLAVQENEDFTKLVVK